MRSSGESSIGYVSLAVEKLVESTRAEIENLPPFSNECCIYRVPKELYEVNKKVCTPQLVSIGPFHHGKEELKAMEAHKTLYLKIFLQKTKLSLEDLYEHIENNETKLRACYEESIEFSSAEFVKMMLHDSVFVIAYLLRYSIEEFQTEINDRIHEKPWKANAIRFDMCILENQLPFFILDELVERFGIISHCKGWSTIKLVCEFLKPIWGPWPWVPNDILEKVVSSDYKVAHFVDFIRICQIPTDNLHEHEERNQDARLDMPSAIELDQAGVEFMPVPESDSWKLFDIRFDKGILNIPSLEVTDHTEIIFRNIQAFEQCYCRVKNRYFNDYISIFGMIVKSTKDAKLLVQKGIIKNRIRENYAVYRLFMNLCKGNQVTSDFFYFRRHVEDLNKYNERCINKLRVELKQKYFSSPLATLSFCLAGFLLILTIVQTVFSIIKVV